jgi:hypothetical protein
MHAHATPSHARFDAERLRQSLIVAHDRDHRSSGLTTPQMLAKKVDRIRAIVAHTQQRKGK